MNVNRGMVEGGLSESESLLFKHNPLAIEHPRQHHCEHPCRQQVGGDRQNDLHRLIAHGEHPADALDAVVDGNEEQAEALVGAPEHTADANDRHHQHEGGDQSGGLLDRVGQGRQNGDEGNEDQNGGEDHAEDHGVVPYGVDGSIHNIHGLAAHELGQGQKHAREAAESTEEGHDGQGGDLTQRQLAPLDGGDGGASLDGRLSNE